MSKTKAEKKPVDKKLLLKYETPRTLSEETLDDVAGGQELQSGGHSCYSTRAAG